MRHLVSFPIIAAALAFAGCSTVPGGTTLSLDQITTDLTSAEKVVTAVACTTGPLAQTASGVARRKVAAGGTLGGSSANQIINTIYVSSKALCTLNLGGTAAGTTTVPASQVTPVAPASGA